MTDKSDRDARGWILYDGTCHLWFLRQQWWSWPLWLLVAVPPGRWLFNGIYRVEADHRRQICAVCHLLPHSLPKGDRP
jgi:hypothetical protein